MRNLWKLLATKGRHLHVDGSSKSVSRKYHVLTRNTLGLSWLRCCVLKFQAYCSAVKSETKPDSRVKEWTTPLILKEPEYNMDFLLNPENHPEILENIQNRKGVGNIEQVVELWNRLSQEKNVQIRERLREQFLEAAGNIPNRSHPDSPIGDEENARLVGTVGTQRDFNFTPRTVVELGEQLGMLRTSNVHFTTGNGTYFFLDQLAMLEQALVKYTINFLLDKGFELVSVPDLLDPQVIEGCGFKTTGEVTQVYKLDSSCHRNLCLAGTSEMPLAGFFINEVMKKEDLPKRVAAVSRCYRAEVSSLEEESGIYRVHQFTKVEMFGVCGSETGREGEDLLQELLDIERTLFSQLGLHFRILDMPTSELGAPAYRKLDMETWMPARGFWGEISSASNCTDYQSRRLNIRYQADDGQLKYCTTVNGTACAVPRTIMAICENFQQQDGSIEVPEVLRQHMDGLASIQKGQTSLGDIGTFTNLKKKSKN